MNGAETYTLILTTAPADKRRETIAAGNNVLKAEEALTADEKKILADIVKVGSLPDKLK
jgi:hypothetical protein